MIIYSYLQFAFNIYILETKNLREEVKMPVVEWSDELSTGVVGMDEQHKVLVDMINYIYKLLEEGKRTEAMEFFSDTLVEYVNMHFSEEEKMLERVGYPDLENHKKIHEQFKKLMMDSVPKIKEGNEHEFKTALALVWGWLYSHILKVDKRYGEYISSKES